MLKVPFGVDNEGHITPIHDARKETDYWCPQCRGALTVRKGKRIRWHFAHRATDGAACSRESYLHLVAKLLLLTRIRTALNNSAELRISLKNRLVIRSNGATLCEALAESTGSSVNLTEGFDQISMEKAVRGVRPDLLLEGPRGVLGIEVLVSSPATETKLLALPIAEFKVTSLEDLEWLWAGEWSECDSLSVSGVDNYRNQKDLPIPTLNGSALLSLRERSREPGQLIYNFTEKVRSVYIKGTQYPANFVRTRSVDMAESFEGGELQWCAGALMLTLRARRTGKSLWIIGYGGLMESPRGVDVISIDPGLVVQTAANTPIRLDRVRRPQRSVHRETDVHIGNEDRAVLCYGFRGASPRTARFEISAHELDLATRHGTVRVVFIEDVYL